MFLKKLFKTILRRKRVYLDAASATPVDPRVLKAMKPYWIELYANPGAIYKEGKAARDALLQARIKVARTLSVRPEEVTFVSGGTEANNVAIRGLIYALVKRGRAPDSLEVISTKMEHSSVLACLDELRSMGVHVTYLPVREDGIVEVKALESLLNKKTVLVSVHLVNNEVGVVQPIREIARVIEAYKKVHEQETYLHSDASQAPLFINCSPERLHAHLLTLDGQKIYGPKGIGMLYHKTNVPLEPVIRGGGQEGGLRSGTEPLPLIAGFAEALAIAAGEREYNEKKIAPLRDYFIHELQRALPQAEINGSLRDRIANNVHISLPGTDTEFLTIHLDHMGVAVSTKSTCLTNEAGSYVVAALGKSSEHAKSTLRMTLPLAITRSDIDVAVVALTRAVQKLDRK